MPIEEQVPYVQPADLDTEPLKRAAEDIEDSFALSLCLNTFNLFEIYRSQNHDRRWSVADALYCGWMPNKVWDGTNTPRANLSVFTVFNQVEALVPAISQAVFNGGADWFQVVPEGETTPEEAKQIQDAMSYYLDHPKDEFSNNAQAEYQLAFKQLALYGNGGVSVEWDAVKGRPSIQAVDIRDFYIDPACPTPSTSDSRAVIRRKFFTVDELLAFKDKDARMKIPSRNQLYAMSMNYAQTYGDETKRIQEGFRGVFYSPGSSDFVPNPADRLVEVLIYESRQRIIWVFNREWVAYKGPNPYGFYTFDFAPCYVYSGRWYALSIPDVQEGYQRFTEGLLNGRLDEISMALHPPRTMPRGANLTPAQLRWKPGAVYAIDKPRDAQVFQPQNVTANIYEEISYIDSLSEKTTGITGLGGSGVPRASNANRTLGGMQMQNAGSGNRISQIVSQVENYLIVPSLYKLYKIVGTHTKPGAFLPAYNSTDGVYQINGEVFYKPVSFRMDAASRMVTRDRLMQIVPFLSQYVLQGPLVQQLHQIGNTIDFEVFFNMIQDAAGTGQLYHLMRPMNQQEQQALNQPPPQVVAQQQQAQTDQQTRLQIMDKKVQGQLQVEQIKKQPNAPDPYTIQAQQQQAEIQRQQAMQQMATDQQANQQQLQQQVLMNRLKLAAEQEKHRTAIASKVAELQLKKQEIGQKAQASQAMHQMNMQQQLEQMAMNQAQAQAQGQPPAAAPADQTSEGNSTPKSPNRLRKKAENHPRSKAPK